MVGCSKRSGHDKDVSFYRVPVIIRNEGELTEELTTERRRKWISAISRDDITEKKMENDRVCGSHFVSGKPASNWDKLNVNWVPTLNLGHNKNDIEPKDQIAAGKELRGQSSEGIKGWRRDICKKNLKGLMSREFLLKRLFSLTLAKLQKIEELAQQNKPQTDIEILRALTTLIQIVQD